MLSKKENIHDLNQNKVYDDLIKFLEENPRSCPDDMLYLYIITNGITGEFDSGFYPAAACVKLSIGDRNIDCHVDCLTDITLKHLRYQKLEKV